MFKKETKKHIFSLFILVFCISSYSQSMLVEGLVVDHKKRPIFTTGSIVEKIDISDTSLNHINDSTTEQDKYLINSTYIGNELNTIVFSFGCDRFNASFNDYSEFTPEYLKIFNDKALSYYCNIAVSGYFHNFFGSLGYGFSFSGSNTVDSIRISFRSEKIKFIIGYGFSIIKSRLVITPNIAFDRLNYRLLTSDKAKTISLSKYLTENQYDLRIGQWMSTLGINLDFKLYKRPYKSFFYSTYLSIGTGYSFKLSKKPEIKSDVNKVSSDSRIKFQNLYLQAGLRFYFPK